PPRHSCESRNPVSFAAFRFSPSPSFAPCFRRIGGGRGGLGGGGINRAAGRIIGGNKRGGRFCGENADFGDFPKFS
ncbi:MAG: hypothetical protein ACR2P5_07115, partial [Gammaproteobacteria bacterium]